MRLCIVTVIKDEHLYLDDFLTYHLGLGIDHIFVYEDVNSKSHKSICDKYENVSLHSVKELFQDGLSVKPKQLNVYWRILPEIKINYDYEWCFFIDSDEYITLENEGDNLHDIMSEYKNYDCVILKWMNYGADGRVERPDYSKIRVVDAFTTPTTNMMRKDNEANSSKIAYNMNRFSKKVLSYHHMPSKIARWCWTDYTNDIMKPSYKKVYIRHYITKSWDEYVWKIKVRGDYYKGNRKYQNFFDINKDMEDRKEELMGRI